MKMFQDERRLDFCALGREIKRKREAKGWTQEYFAQLVDRTPRSNMYIENRGQHPSLNTFYQFVTLLEISVYQFFYSYNESSKSDCRKHIDVLLSSMDERELTIVEATAEGLKRAREMVEVKKCVHRFLHGSASRAGVSTPAIFAAPEGLRKYLLGSSPNPLTSGLVVANCAQELWDKMSQSS